MELFEIHAGSFIGVAVATPLQPKKQIRAIDAGAVTFNYTVLTKNTGENIGTGNDILVDFTVSKTPIVYEKDLVVYVDGVVVPKTAYTVVLATGVITFAVAPANTLAVTADYFTEDATTKVVSMLAGEAFKIGGACDSVTSTALQNVILS